MNFSKRSIQSIAFAIFFLWTSVYSPAIGNDQGDFTLNLVDADIATLIKTIADATGKNFVVDPRVSGRVTVISTNPVDAEKLYDMFLSVLQVHGFSAVSAGSLIKILPDFSAKESPIPVMGVTPRPRDQLVSKVIPIIHVPVDPLVPILRPMVPQEGLLSSNPTSNSLLVTDRAANIERLIEIIKLIDVPGSDQVDVVHLRQASATDVVQTLAPLQGNGAGPSSSIRLVADVRTNSILVSGSLAARNRMRGLIHRLDAPVESGGNTQVVSCLLYTSPSPRDRG